MIRPKSLKPSQRLLLSAVLRNKARPTGASVDGRQLIAFLNRVKNVNILYDNFRSKRIHLNQCNGCDTVVVWL